jgi:hypothetical protein
MLSAHATAGGVRTRACAVLCCVVLLRAVQEVAGLMADLAKERAAHDATRKQLEAARTSLKSPAASGAAPPSPAAAAAPAAGASSAAAAAAAGGSGGGRKLSAAGRASKRRRGADAAEDADVPAGGQWRAPSHSAHTRHCLVWLGVAC